MPALLSLPWPGRWQDARNRVDLLQSWPADPRITDWLLYPLKNGLYRDGSAFYQSFYRLLKHQRDPRAPEVVDRHKAWLQQNFHFHEDFTQTWVRELRAVVAESPNPQAEAALLAPLQSALANQTELLHQIYQNPNDQELRLVYADLLTEQGNPRGLFIQYQVKRLATRAPARKPERDLQNQYGHLWYEVDNIKPDGTQVFEGGFLTAAEFSERIPWDIAFANPAWATVRQLTGTPSQELLKNIHRAPSIRALYGFYTLDPTPERLLQQFTTLGTEYLGNAAITADLPKLRYLHLGVCNGHLRWLDHCWLDRLLLGSDSLYRIWTGVGDVELWRGVIGLPHDHWNPHKGWIVEFAAGTHGWKQPDVTLRYRPDPIPFNTTLNAGHFNYFCNRLGKLTLIYPEKLPPKQQAQIRQFQEDLTVPFEVQHTDEQHVPW